MAFTTEQEAQLLEVLGAFQNGKRVNELPHVNGTSNPFNLISEVLDEDGESKQARLAEFLPYLESQCAYGIEMDTSVSSPLCTRIGNGDLHKSLPVQSRMKGCLLDDNGKVVVYLNSQNWNTHDLSGASGQVMVEIPRHYRKFETEGTKRRAFISEYPLPGYHVVPTSYISAYEATVQRSTNMLCSVKNMDVDFRGGGNQADWDNTYKSLLGRPATNLGRQTFRAYARKRKENSSEWNCQIYEMYKTVYWLFVIEYANLNSQESFNAEPTISGYKQGGLGSGVTEISDWGGFNGYYPFVPCGYTDSLGNQSGVVVYETLNEDGTLRYNAPVPRYRGIENPFGHVYKHTDGININTQSPEEGGESKVYVCKNPALFNDSGYNGYSHVGNQPRQD